MEHVRYQWVKWLTKIYETTYPGVFADINYVKSYLICIESEIFAVCNWWTNVCNGCNHIITIRNITGVI